MRLVAVRIKTCAYREVSNKIGNIPPIVVSDVNRTGRRRPASNQASCSGKPSRSRRLMKWINNLHCRDERLLKSIVDRLVMGQISPKQALNGWPMLSDDLFPIRHRRVLRREVSVGQNPRSRTCTARITTNPDNFESIRRRQDALSRTPKKGRGRAAATPFAFRGVRYRSVPAQRRTGSTGTALHAVSTVSSPLP